MKRTDGPIASLDAVEDRYISCCCQESKVSSGVQPAAK